MKDLGNKILGLIFIVIGIIIMLNALDVTNIDIFFDGWWTLFIIIPSLVSLINQKDITGSLIVLFIGVLLLLSAQNVLDFDIILKLLLPAIMIIIGLSFLFKDLFNNKVSEEIKKINAKKAKDGGYTSTFSSQNVNLDGEDFSGCEINAVFGGVKLNLDKAVIKNDVVINCSAIFGGIELCIPDNMKVKIKSNSIFGGVEDKRKNIEVDKKSVTIYINATCLFGGVEIK